MLKNRFLGIALLLSILLFSVIVVGIPTTPQAFYGTIAGAPIGTVITAKINGVTVGSYTLTTSGVYGGADASSDKLVVCASEGCSSGDLITFRATNGTISTTTTFIPGAVTQLALSFTLGYNEEYYTKEEIDTMFGEIEGNYYTKEQINAMLQERDEQIEWLQTLLNHSSPEAGNDSYTKEEIKEMFEERDEKLNWLQKLLDRIFHYFSFVSSTIKKKAICDYAEEENLTNYIDLGYNCTIAPVSSGTRMICRCVTLKN